MPRTVVRELMDAPDVDEADHRRALEGLARINRASNAAATMLEPIVAFSRRAGLSRLSVLDVACGGGDVPIAMAQVARRYGLTVNLTLLDRSPLALERGRTAARAAGIACTTILADITRDSPTTAEVVTSSLFLHHLDGEDRVTAVLRRLAGLAERLLVISDLRRSRLGLAAAWAGCRVLSGSPIVRHDGPASVRAAWTVGELSECAASAGLEGAKISRVWPWRMLLTWEKVPGNKP